MAHLAKKSNGHLLKKANGHLVKWSAPTYSSAYNSTIYWTGYEEVEIPVADITGAEIVTLVNGAVANYVADTGVSVGGLIGISASYARAGWTQGNVFANGAIYKITVQAGRTFGTPTADLTLTSDGFTPPFQMPWDTSGCTYIVGTGSAAPTGDPRGWDDNIVTAGTSSQTLQDQALQEYLWICCLITPWGGLSTDESTPRGMQVELSISDLKE